MKTKLLFTFFIVLLSTSIGAQTLWDEGTDGDLSDDGTNPSGVFVLIPESDNLVIANQVGNPRDVDFFAFTVPEDFQLEALIIEDYNSADNVAFMAIDAGATTDVDFMNPQSSDLLGGTTYGTASIGSDILPQMGTLGGATGFTPPLPPGDYTIWLNQTGAISVVTLNLVLGEVLSLEDNNLATTISLFPNPAQNNIQVSSEEPVNKIVLYNILGKEVKQVNNSNFMNITGMANGIYLAHITTASGIVTRKVVKQ